MSRALVGVRERALGCFIRSALNPVELPGVSLLHKN